MVADSDLHMQAESLQSMEEYRTIFETTGTATIIIEEDTILSKVNSEFANMVGFSKEEIEGKKSWTEFFSPDEVEKSKEYHRLRRLNREYAPSHYESKLNNRQGQEIDIAIAVEVLPGGKRSVASFLDITKRKQMEAALRQTQEELEQRVLDRTAELAAANGALRAEVEERRRAEEIISRQAQEILEVSTPVIQIWEGIVTVPLIGTLDSQRTQQLMEQLLNRIVETNSSVALIDVTGVPTIDTQTAQHLIETISAVRLLGAQVVLTGIRPVIAQTLVHLGIDLTNINTRSSLSAGLLYALNLLNLHVTDKGRGA